MILSRIFAKRRMAANERPSFGAAWGLVALDFGIVAAILLLLFVPIMYTMYAMQPNDAASVLFMTALYVVWPLWILIRGGIWAYRSRLVQT